MPDKKIDKNNKNQKYAGKFCPKCGKNIDKGVFCNKCQEIDFEFKDIFLTLCNSCKSYLYHNKWAKYEDLKETVNKISKDSIKAKAKIIGMKDEDIEEISAYKAGVNRGYIVEVEYQKNYFEIPIKIDITLCPKCSKNSDKYFEGILQLRNSSKEINEFVRLTIKRQNKKGIFINKESKLEKYSEENIDFYISNNSYIKIIGELVKKNYGGILKKNAQLFSLDHQTSKNLYRTNVLVEISRYKKSDVIKEDNNLLQIISMGDRINVLNIKTNSKTSLPHKEGYQILKPITMQVIKIYPEVEVLDPETYYQCRLMNPSEKIQVNQKIQAVVDCSEAWMM